MILVGLTGVARSGKDTVGKILCDELGFERRSFADKLRAVALGADPWIPESATCGFNRTEYGCFERLSIIVDRYGWERAKENPEVRRFLQKLGTEGVRENLGHDTWIKAANRDLMSSITNESRIVFTDVRFENEAHTIRNLGGEVWRIERPGFEPVNAHISDAGIPPELLNRTIVNSGTITQLKAGVLNHWSIA